MPLVTTKAVSLKNQRWGDADRIVTLYTQRLGKIRGIARGARKMKSRFGAALEPFGLLEVTVFEKSTDTLARMSHTDILESFGELRENLILMAAAARMVNLVRAITAERDPNSLIFDTLLGGLRSLKEGCDPALATLVFQIHILGHAGFRPQTDHCASCSRIMNSTRIRFSPTSGGLICEACTQGNPYHGLPMSPGSLSFIHQARRLSFPTVTRLRATGQIRREVEEAIESYLKVVVGKALPTFHSWAAEDPSPSYG